MHKERKMHKKSQKSKCIFTEYYVEIKKVMCYNTL